MRTRNNDWLDTCSREALFGIDVKRDGGWKYYAENGKIYFASSEEERELKRKELRKLRS